MPYARPRLKQLLLATALAGACAAPALAQTNVTVSGLVDAYAGSVRMAGDPASTASVNSGGMTTSWMGFKGSEDLGGGLKANFALTTFFQADTGTQGRFFGDTLFSRDANIGLSGSFGTVTLGRGLAPNFLPSILFNPFGDSFSFSPLILHMDVPLAFRAGNTSGWGSTIAADTGWSNEIIYTTPDIGGLTANLHYQFGEQAGSTGKNNFGGNLLYFNGPLSLTAFYENAQMTNPQPVVQNRSKTWFVGGGYDFNVAKLFATYQKTSVDHDVSGTVDQDFKTWSLGLSAPAGQGKILAAYAQTKEDIAGSDRTRGTASIGYDYNLSKRTDVYAIYMNDRITDQSNGNSFGVGIRHRF
ncbi:MAG: porin [Burkholderiaceae bacterium]